MSKHRPPDEEEMRIIRENQIEPDGKFAVTHRTETEIYLLCYKTRDEIVIRKGDRKW